MKKNFEVVEIKWNDCDLTISGTYYPREKSTNDYPGANAEFEIDEIYYKKRDVSLLLDVDSVFEDIAELCVNEIEENKK